MVTFMKKHSKRGSDGGRLAVKTADDLRKEAKKLQEFAGELASFADSMESWGVETVEFDGRGKYPDAVVLLSDYISAAEKPLRAIERRRF